MAMSELDLSERLKQCPLLLIGLNRPSFRSICFPLWQKNEALTVKTFNKNAIGNTWMRKIAKYPALYVLLYWVTTHLFWPEPITLLVLVAAFKNRVIHVVEGGSQDSTVLRALTRHLPTSSNGLLFAWSTIGMVRAEVDPWWAHRRDVLQGS